MATFIMQILFPVESMRPPLDSFTLMLLMYLWRFSIYISITVAILQPLKR